MEIAQDQAPARADLEGPQGGIRRDGPRVAELLRAGRRRAAHQAAGSAPHGFARSRQRSGLRIGNVFHAGDGNLHPLICYDEAIPGQAEHAEQVASEILSTASTPAASITGEHGVGADKKALHAADVRAPTTSTRCSSCAAPSIPTGICNPGKVFPTPRLCGEVPGPYRQHPLERAGVAERF